MEKRRALPAVLLSCLHARNACAGIANMNRRWHVAEEA
jgi:hypothetical protein